MKKILLLLLLIPSLCFSQMTRPEVLIKLEEHEKYEIEQIIENTSMIIVTNNLFGEVNIDAINYGVAPIQETTYQFWDDQQNSKLKTVTTIYSHKIRRVVSSYSNERQPKREDYVGYIFSEVRTIVRGPVEYDSQSEKYFTREVSFNLE